MGHNIINVMKFKLFNITQMPYIIFILKCYVDIEPTEIQ